MDKIPKKIEKTIRDVETFEKDAVADIHTPSLRTTGKLFFDTDKLVRDYSTLSKLIVPIGFLLFKGFQLRK